MIVLLIQIDKTGYPNLALEKVAKFHADRGHEVAWDLPIVAGKADAIYVSCIFDWNRTEAAKWQSQYPDKCVVGGSGYSLYSALPSEMEAIKPRINWGFTTRGCIRKCPFCVVPEKEGNIHIVGDLLDLWDGRSKTVTILDNNILAMPDHFKLICKQARDHKLQIDFNQGLDFRLLTPEIVHELKITSTRYYRFSFDDPAYLPQVERAVKMLKAGGINEGYWYVLVGFNTTLQQDFDRLNFLKINGQKAYLQRYSKDRVYIPIAQWVNQPAQFAKKTFMQFLETRPDRQKYKPYFEGLQCVN